MDEKLLEEWLSALNPIVQEEIQVQSVASWKVWLGFPQALKMVHVILVVTGGWRVDATKQDRTKSR